jgi:hypothetical protein
MLSARISGTAEQPFHRALGHVLRGELVVLLEHGVFCRLKDTVEPTQDDHRQHDQPILGRTIGTAQAVRDFPDVVFELIVSLQIHSGIDLTCFFNPRFIAGLR